MRTRQKRVATDTWRSLGWRTTPLEHWSKRKPLLNPGGPSNRQKSSGPRKETVWIYIGRTGFTLFRRFRRFRRAELPDEYSMQCTPPKYFLRHKCLRKDHFIRCSSIGDVTERRNARYNRSSCCTDQFRK